jgi:hypothetical protein
LQDEFPFTWQDIVGTARDLGPYEYQSPQPAGMQMLLTHDRELSLACRDGNIIFMVPENGRVRVDVLSLQGQFVTTNANLLATGGAQYSIPLANLPSGIYILRMTFKGQSRVIKISIVN